MGNVPPKKKKRDDGEEGSEDEDGKPEKKDRSVTWTECPNCTYWLHDECNIKAANGVFCGYCRSPLSLKEVKKE